MHEWAAGAGLDAVLERDEEMLIGMFGKASGITPADVNRYFDSDEMWNTALQPLAIQLPDWKHWLPLIHPKDAFSRNEYFESDKTRDPKRGYETLRSYLEENRGNYTARKLFHELHQFWLHYRLFLERGSTARDHWRSTDGDALVNGLAAGVSAEMAANSLAKHLAVKFFEVHHEFDLQGLAPTLIDRAEHPRKRQWLGRQYNVFEVPPHFTACFKSGSARCHNFEGQPRQTGEYESTSWYQLQQVINPGIATSRAVVPVDYNYVPTLIVRASHTSGILEPVRFFYSSNVMYQTRTRAAVFTPMDREGFHMRIMGPWLFYGADNRNRFEGLEPGSIPRLLNDLQPGLGTMIVAAQLRQFLTEMAKPQNNLVDWGRRATSDGGDQRALDPITLTTADMPQPQTTFSGDLRHYAHKIYWVIPKFVGLGVDCNIIAELQQWASQAWPNIDWEPLGCALLPATP